MHHNGENCTVMIDVILKKCKYGNPQGIGINNFLFPGVMEKVYSGSNQLVQERHTDVSTFWFEFIINATKTI